MTPRMRLTLVCAAGTLMAGIAGAAYAQDGRMQPPASGTTPPAQTDTQPGVSPAIPAEQLQVPPRGCPYRNQKLELIA